VYVYQSQVHDVEELLDICYRLKQSVVDSEYGPENILSNNCGNISSHGSSEAIFQIRRLYFSNRLALFIKLSESSVQLCHQGSVEQLQHF